MKIRSLAYKTELIFLRFEGKITDCDEYLVIETPSNPGFFWGNLLLFRKPPTREDYPAWKDAFRNAFAHNPLVRHMTLAWDGVDGQLGEVDPFVKDGFTVEKSVVMTAERVRAPTKYNKDVTVRPLLGDGEWEQAYENQVKCRSAGFDLESYRLFKRRQMERYRKMANAGHGLWFGAFLGDRLVGDLGIYRDGTLGRFQVVSTHPEFRRQGICGALVHQSSEYAFRQMGIEKLIMVADPDDHPSRIYASVGFQETERAAGMYWREKKS